ncbi:hypothetical protein Y032_0025g1223 [Ancylostoma ceylanicum]|uniref:Uncharacterized protein n=1 Tax=Ancylostoma ceylanicum TaxID=53326 RepID=A0A016UW01_9BILA|nr:hypothetical protein Y032_0025g1223 [Ancylostoma ceylanicum]
MVTITNEICGYSNTRCVNSLVRIFNEDASVPILRHIIAIRTQQLESWSRPNVHLQYEPVISADTPGSTSSSAGIPLNEIERVLPIYLRVYFKENGKVSGNCKVKSITLFITLLILLSTIQASVDIKELSQLE